MKPAFVLPVVAMLAAAMSSTGSAKEVVKTFGMQGGAAFRAVKYSDISSIDYNGSSYQGARNTSTSSKKKVVATVPMDSFPVSPENCQLCHATDYPSGLTIGVDAYHTKALTTTCLAFTRDADGEIQASESFDVVSTGAGPTYGVTSALPGLVAFGRSVSVQCELATNKQATLVDILSYWAYDDGEE